MPRGSRKLKSVSDSGRCDTNNTIGYSVDSLRLFRENESDFCSTLSYSFPVQQINPEIYKRGINENGTEIRNRTNKYINRINKYH